MASGSNTHPGGAIGFKIDSTLYVGIVADFFVDDGSVIDPASVFPSASIDLSGTQSADITVFTNPVSGEYMIAVERR